MRNNFLLAFLLLILALFLNACSTSNNDDAENTLAMCTNQIDDDANGKTDCDDQSCINAGMCGEDSEANCQDGSDNDADDLVDCEDGSCSFTETCAHVASQFRPIPSVGGIQPAVVNSNRLQEMYEDWIADFYEEDTEDPTLARVKRDKEQFTVSEGIGYGMLITVAMDTTADRLTKLWNYYKKFSTDRGLMNWCIVEFDSVATPCDHGEQNGFNAATDAEMDVVVALLQAYKKWNIESFLTDAEELAQAMRTYEVDMDDLLKPGDVWNSRKNPSYFAPAAIALMDQAFPEQNWGPVLTANYAYHDLCANNVTGLVPDWCNIDGTPVSWGPDFGFEAVRNPWRIAMHTLWFGSADANARNIQIANWINQQTAGDPSNIAGGYTISGEAKGLGLGGTMVPTMCLAGTSDPIFQDWLDRCYEYAEGRNVSGYYQASVNLIMLLTMSGHLQNYW